MRDGPPQFAAIISPPSTPLMTPKKCRCVEWFRKSMRNLAARIPQVCDVNPSCEENRTNRTVKRSDYGLFRLRRCEMKIRTWPLIGSWPMTRWRYQVTSAPISEQFMLSLLHSTSRALIFTGKRWISSMSANTARARLYEILSRVRTRRDVSEIFANERHRTNFRFIYPARFLSRNSSSRYRGGGWPTWATDEGGRRSKPLDFSPRKADSISFAINDACERSKVNVFRLCQRKTPRMSHRQI